MGAQRRPTTAQVRVTKAVVRWYLRRYFRTEDDQGTPAMFMDKKRIGAFAVDREDLKRGDGAALFKLLVATTMFQRRQDVQIARILRGINKTDARELTTQQVLFNLLDRGVCAAMQNSAALHERCDLAKEPHTGRAVCAVNPRAQCHLKRHTSLLQRYGDFGKAPTSAALILRESGAEDLRGLRLQILRRFRTPAGRARALEEALSRFWRIDKKLASMFLSAVSNPDLSPGTAPWSRGIDWRYFVVIDTNVYSFLKSINRGSDETYDDRRAVVQALAAKIDLRRLDKRLRPYNPRIVQQAMYLFMSAANRREIPRDCMHLGSLACIACPTDLAKRCPVRST